jgi:hypothetical protein
MTLVPGMQLLVHCEWKLPTSKEKKLRALDFNLDLIYPNNHGFIDEVTSSRREELCMTIYGKEKRTKGRVKREYLLDIKIGNESKKVYSIDLSEGGVKVGGAMLMLKPGEQVEISVDKDGQKFTFRGQVARNDGSQRINRIGREANAFFVRILDERFPEFVKKILQ